ncbi:hypothetical protein V8B97DRAFT_2025114 [Scleroderma yunnanense]
MAPTLRYHILNWPPNLFYNHKHISHLGVKFIIHSFTCPELPPSSSGSTVKVPYFIAYTLHQTKIHPSITFAALVLLQHLKAQFSTEWGSSAMMEREMCQYLEWELNVDPVTWKEFKGMVWKDFVPPTPPPLLFFLPGQEVNSTAICCPLPSLSCGISSLPSIEEWYPSLPKVNYISSPPSYGLSPEISSPMYSTSSPASLASSPTPTSIKDLSTKIIEDLSTKIMSTSSSSSYPKLFDHTQVPATKSKVFAFTSPAMW